MKHEPIHQSPSSERHATDFTSPTPVLKNRECCRKKVAKKWGKLFRNRACFRFRKNEDECYEVNNTTINFEGLGEQGLIFEPAQLHY